MKKIYILWVFCSCIGCDSENAFDCLQAAGNRIETEFIRDPFSKITIENDVRLIVSQSDTQKIVIETGENLLNDIDVYVENGMLVIRNNNICNFVRDYGITKAFVNSPNITAIRNSSFNTVQSEGLLIFPRLSLVSNSTAGPEDISKGGDFNLHIACEQLSVSANGQSVFYIRGTAEEASLSFEDEWPRFQGENLIINKLNIFQRSANDMIVDPRQEIIGEIRGTGNVISLYHPPVIDVEEYFSGTLIFQD